MRHEYKYVLRHLRKMLHYPGLPFRISQTLFTCLPAYHRFSQHVLICQWDYFGFYEVVPTYNKPVATILVKNVCILFHVPNKCSACAFSSVHVFLRLGCCRVFRPWLPSHLLGQTTPFISSLKTVSNIYNQSAQHLFSSSNSYHVAKPDAS